jgi:hypothetical protein
MAKIANVFVPYPAAQVDIVRHEDSNRLRKLRKTRHAGSRSWLGGLRILAPSLPNLGENRAKSSHSFASHGFGERRGVSPTCI